MKKKVKQFLVFYNSLLAFLTTNLKHSLQILTERLSLENIKVRTSEPESTFRIENSRKFRMKRQILYTLQYNL